MMPDKLGKLKEIYLSLPESIIMEACDTADYNRQTKREIKKVKTIKAKLDIILADEIKHKRFIEYISNQYNMGDNNYESVNEVIDDLNCNNFIQLIIYLIKNFYLSDELEEYILSSKFDKTFESFKNLRSEKGEKVNNNMMRSIEINDKEAPKKFIVSIEEKNGFYNMYPLYRIEDGTLIKEEEENYPEYGNINISPWFEFSKKGYNSMSPIWICRLAQNQLEETQNRTKFKVDGDKLIRSKNIYNINDEGMYEIVELLEDSNILEELVCNDKIEIKSKPNMGKVYIRDRSYIYGPFGYKENNLGGGYYIDKKSNDYIIDKISISENQKYLAIEEIENPYNYSNSLITIVYFHNESNLISEKVDIISDEELLDNLKKVIDTKNLFYTKNQVEEVRANIMSVVCNCLSEARQKRVADLIKNTAITEKFIENDLIDIIGLLLDGKDTKEIIANKILNKHEILRKLQNVELVQSKIDSKNEELEKAKQELEKIQSEIEDANNKNIQKLIERNQLEIKEMTDTKEKIEKDIEELSKKYNLCIDIEKLNLERKRLEEEAKSEKSKYEIFLLENQKIKEQGRKIEKEIKEKLENVTNQYSDITFDGMIANEMLEAAAKWSKNKYLENFETKIVSKEKVEKLMKIKSFKDENIIDYLCNKINQYRNYSRNDIINIMICLSQGFLTVFAGEPGVGKTSICSIIANSLGLTNRNPDYYRFAEISVEKGWTSKRDLIGYYNPLTKSFDKNNSALYKTFNVLHQEYIKGVSDFPYYILLDEANLSSMEHYWADFMNVCDLDKENRKINLGEDYIYFIPQTLRFLATINYDHTTETLSPRLIDRAWIILLEGNNYNTFTHNSQIQQISDEIIMFKDLEKLFAYSSYNEQDEELPNQMYKELDEIYKMFTDNNMHISPRIDNMIKKYLKVGCNLFDKTKNTAQEFVALDYVVAQKLLPKVNGYGNEYRGFLQGMEKCFDKNNMMKCKNIINNIIKKGDSNMQYYQFFS